MTSPADNVAAAERAAERIEQAAANLANFATGRPGRVGGSLAEMPGQT